MRFSGRAQVGRKGLLPMRQAVAGRVFGKRLERVTRIELVTEAWEAFVIPFHHTRITRLDLRAVRVGVKHGLA